MSQSNNPLKAQRDWPPVVVAGGYQTGVNLMRSLSRRGLTVYCVENDRKKQAFRSIYGKTYECPDPDTLPGGWASFMLDLASKLPGKPVLIASADAFVSVMAKYAGALRTAYVFCYDTAVLQGELVSKKGLYELAVRHQMPAPKTRLARSLDEVVEFGLRARFPCVVKPARSRDWSNVPRTHLLANCKAILTTSLEDLGEKYRIISQISPQVVVQESIQGPDNAKMVYLSCYGAGGRRLGHCIARELRTAPIYNGNASVVEPVLDDEVDSLCDNFLKGIGYEGLCEIELKRDIRDGRILMIEANPRYTGTSDAAPHAGVDLGWLHYLELIGQPVESVRQVGSDFRHIALTWDFSTIGSYRRAGLLTWRELFRSYKPPLAFFDFHLRDWRLAAETLVTMAYLALARPIRIRLEKRKTTRTEDTT